MQEECGSFPADSGVSFLNVMHSLSLLPNNCPKDQQPDERERFILLLVDAISVKKQLQGPALGRGEEPLSVQLLEPTERTQWASGAAPLPPSPLGRERPLKSVRLGQALPQSAGQAASC